MFLLFGTRLVASVVFAVTFVCGHCGVAATQRIVRGQNKVTLFFVPLFPIGTSWSVECSNCGAATALTRDQAEHSMRWAAAHRIATV